MQFCLNNPQLSGLVAFPTAMVNKDEQVLKCTPCGQQFCPSDFDQGDPLLKEFLTGMLEMDRNDTDASSKMINQLSLASTVTDYLNNEWVDSYCLVTDLGVQIQYFPFVILLMAVGLCLVQKISNA